MNFMLVGFKTKVLVFEMKLLFGMKVLVFAVKEGTMEIQALGGCGIPVLIPSR